MASKETLKIKAGLDKGTGYTSKNKARSGPKLAHLVGRKNTLSNIRTNQLQAVKAYREIRLLGEKSAKKMAELDAMIRDRWKDEGYIPGEINGVPVRTDTWGVEARSKRIRKDIEAAQKAVNQEQAEELSKIMKDLGEAGAANAMFRKGHKNPHSMLLTNTIGERRNNLLAGMERDDPFGVEITMTRAMGDNDKELAAAACIAYDRLTAEQKQLVEHSRDDVAEALVWTEWCDQNAATAKTLFAVEMGHVLADQMQGRDVPAGKKTGIALRFHEAGANLGLEFSEDELAPPAVATPLPEVTFEDNYKPEKSEALKRAEAFTEVMRLHGLDRHTKAKELADKWGLDLYDDEETNEGTENE
jgi:hypothetical protein